MAYFLFVDECGTDRKTTPYEVVAGLAIEDRDLWRFIRDVHELEELIFGCRYSREEDTETKAKKLLKKKGFQTCSATK